MKRLSSNAIVGFASLGAFLILLLFTFIIKESLWGPRTELNVMFDRVIGLEIGAPVYIAGVYAGQVTKISYLPQNLAKPVSVRVSLSRQFRIYGNAVIRIIQTGIIGDQRMEIDPGNMSARPLASGDAIDGEPQFSLDQSLRQGQEILSDISISVKMLRSLLTDEENVRLIRSTLSELEDALTSINELVQGSQPEIIEAVSNLRAASAQMNQLMVHASTLVDTVTKDVGMVRDSLTSGVARLEGEAVLARQDVSRMTERIGRTADETTTFVASTREQMEPTLKNLQEVTVHLNKILADAHAGKGTVGLLLNDPGPFEELNRVLRSLRQALSKAGAPDSAIRYEIPPGESDSSRPPAQKSEPGTAKSQ